MAVTRLKRKERKNKTISRLKQQHIKLNKRVILIKSPNKSGIEGETAAALPVNEANPKAKKGQASEETATADAPKAETKKSAGKSSNAETQVDSLPASGSDAVDEVGGKSENTPVE
jgi:hypothetical protein